MRELKLNVPESVQDLVIPVKYVSTDEDLAGMMVIIRFNPMTLAMHMLSYNYEGAEVQYQWVDLVDGELFYKTFDTTIEALNHSLEQDRDWEFYSIENLPELSTFISAKYV